MWLTHTTHTLFSTTQSLECRRNSKIRKHSMTCVNRVCRRIVLSIRLCARLIACSFCVPRVQVSGHGARRPSSSSSSATSMLLKAPQAGAFRDGRTVKREWGIRNSSASYEHRPRKIHHSVFIPTPSNPLSIGVSGGGAEDFWRYGVSFPNLSLHLNNGVVA